MPLETPLFGRFLGENKRLVFGPAQEYLWLVGGCIGGGSFFALLGFSFGNSFIGTVAAAVLLAGVWGALSLQWISFNLRERIYLRRQGPGLLPRTTRGSFNDLEAIFLLAEERPWVGRQVTYRIVLQWRGFAEPSMVLQQDYRTLDPGAPMNAGAGPLYQLGARAANALGVPIVDHAHVSTPNPVPIR